MSSGTDRTVSVVGRYRISSNTSVRNTTAPGVAARSSPTVNASGSTIEGTRGGLVRSRSIRRRPRTTLAPPVSMTAFTDSGFRTGTLLGARASTRFVAVNRMRSSSCQSRSASSMSSQAVRAVARWACMARRSSGLPAQAGSAKRLSFFPGASSELPAATFPISRANSPARLATVRGRLASEDAKRSAVPAGGTSRRNGPRAASTRTMSRPITASVASSGGSAGLRRERSGVAAGGFRASVLFFRGASVAGWAIAGPPLRTVGCPRGSGPARRPPGLAVTPFTQPQTTELGRPSGGGREALLPLPDRQQERRPAECQPRTEQRAGNGVGEPVRPQVHPRQGHDRGEQHGVDLPPPPRPSRRSQDEHQTDGGDRARHRVPRREGRGAGRDERPGWPRPVDDGLQRPDQHLAGDHG